MAWVWRFLRSVEADFSGILSVVVRRVSIGSKRKPSVPRITMWMWGESWFDFWDLLGVSGCDPSRDSGL